MAEQQFRFVRLVGSERREGPTLESVSRHWKKEQECFLFVSPHDDDAVIGGGLMIQAAIAEGVPVHLAVVTDGAMGYCSLEERNTISEIRKAETFASCERLGIPKENVHWIGLPDCQLSQYQGRRPAVEGDPVQSHGFTGMQHVFTELLRKVRPNQVFLATASDLHPDHRIVHSEMLISAFHAAGAIWPELGEQLSTPPFLHEYAVYCPFPTEPSLQLKVTDDIFESKLKAIEDFASQKQIKMLVDALREAGPYEYTRPLEFAMYNPTIYRSRFQELPPHGHVTRA